MISPTIASLYDPQFREYRLFFLSAVKKALLITIIANNIIILINYEVNKRKLTNLNIGGYKSKQ